MKPTETPREAYDRGVSLRRIKHRYHMSDSELQDMAPEEFEVEFKPENIIGGY